MVLQEAFMERNDIRKKINRIKSEIDSVIITEEDEQIEFNIDNKLNELKNLEYKLNELNVKIDQANQANIENLQKIKYYDRMISHYSSIRNTLLSYKKNSYLYDNNATMIKNLSLTEITKSLESYENKRRQVDKELQKNNWEITI